MECKRYMTLAFCAFSLMYSLGLSAAVQKVDNDAGFALMAIFGLWNASLLLATWKRTGDYKPSVTCLLCCLSVMILLTASFKYISRYHYYGRWPKDSYGRVGSSSLLYHKMGLILLACGIPLMYKCDCLSLAKDKEIIYGLLADFLDTYGMAEVLALGSPTCERADSINNGIYNRRPSFYCTESTHSSLKEGGSIEDAVQAFCSISFLIYIVIYLEGLGTAGQNTSINSLKCYLKPIILLQDIPFGFIRIAVWIEYGFQTNQFFFLVKNIVSACLTSLDLIFSRLHYHGHIEVSPQSPDEVQQENAEQ